MEHIEPFLLIGLNAVASTVDAEAEKLGTELGAKFKAAVESDKTQLDEYARDRVLKFIAAFQAAAA